MAIRSLKTGQFSRSTQVGNSIILPGDYESIATVTVGSGGSSSIEFTSIPSTFTHLQIRAMHTMSANNAAALLLVGTSNSVDTSASNYYAHRLTGNGSAASAGATADAPQFAWVIGNSNSSNPEVEVIDILDYANTNKYTTIRALSGVDNNGSGEVNLTSGLWKNTAAINIVRLKTNTGNFNQYSHFALYGIRG